MMMPTPNQLSFGRLSETNVPPFDCNQIGRVMVVSARQPPYCFRFLGGVTERPRGRLPSAAERRLVRGVRSAQSRGFGFI